MSQTIEYSIFPNELKSKKKFNSDKLGELIFSWNMEMISQRKILRYKIDDINEIFEIEYDLFLKESGLKTVDDYFLEVIKLLEYQVVLLKEGEYNENIHEDDLNFLRYFETKYDKKHTQGNFK